MSGITEDSKPTGAPGYALVDWRLSKIEAMLLETARNYVQIPIYNVNQQHIVEEFARISLALAGIKATHEKQEANIDLNRLELARSRRQFWTSLMAGTLIVVIGIFAQPIARALGLAP